MTKSQFRPAGVALLMILAVAWAGFGLSVAAPGDCLQQCSDQYAEDLAACSEAHQQALADALAERSACFADAQSFMDYIICNAAYESAKAQANAEKTFCDSRAQSDYIQCTYDCATSPSAP